MSSFYIGWSGIYETHIKLTFHDRILNYGVKKYYFYKFFYIILFILIQVSNFKINKTN